MRLLEQEGRTSGDDNGLGEEHFSGRVTHGPLQVHPFDQFLLLPLLLLHRCLPALGHPTVCSTRTQTLSRSGSPSPIPWVTDPGNHTQCIEQCLQHRGQFSQYVSFRSVLDFGCSNRRNFDIRVFDKAFKLNCSKCKWSKCDADFIQLTPLLRMTFPLFTRGEPSGKWKFFDSLQLFNTSFTSLKPPRV